MCVNAIECELRRQDASATITPSAVTLTKPCTRPAAGEVEASATSVCTTRRDQSVTSVPPDTSPTPAVRWTAQTPAYVWISLTYTWLHLGYKYWTPGRVPSLCWLGRLRLQSWGDGERRSLWWRHWLVSVQSKCWRTPLWPLQEGLLRSERLKPTGLLWSVLPLKSTTWIFIQISYLILFCPRKCSVLLYRSTWLPSRKQLVLIIITLFLWWL